MFDRSFPACLTQLSAEGDDLVVECFLFAGRHSLVGESLELVVAGFRNKSTQEETRSASPSSDRDADQPSVRVVDRSIRRPVNTPLIVSVLPVGWLTVQLRSMSRQSVSAVRATTLT